MIERFTSVQDAVLSLVDSPWILLAVFLLTVIDGFFPPVPSESIVIAAGVLIVAGQGPHIGWLILAASAGAFVGDMIAFTIGRFLPIERIPLLRGEKVARAMLWAEQALAERATVYIMSARFIPIGRVAVNITAGAVGFRRTFFIVIAACAAVCWALYSVALGLVAGTILSDRPLVGVLVGVAGGVIIGFVLDFVLKRVYGRLLSRKAEKFARGESARAGF